MNIPSSIEFQDLPQCKIKRNYSCSHCLYFTQNPRFYLTHLRDVHGERITISNCSLCLYASRHYQKLVRHMKMVHGSTAAAIPGQQRKRPLIEEVVVADCPVIPPLPSPPKWIIDIENLSYDLKSSRKTLRDIAAIYFAENDIVEILDKMEASDVVEVVPSSGVSFKPVFGDPKFVGDEDLDVVCPCGRLCKGLLDLATHSKFCSSTNELIYEVAPLDLSINKLNNDDSACNPMHDIKIEQAINQQDDTKNYYNTADEDLTKDCLKIYKSGLEHSNGFENNPDEENIKIEKAEFFDDEEVKKSQVIPKIEAKSLASHKKVYKCPLCQFWASTASRFHVHIVGHQNKKQFKCSLCSYCSNWRWDITKHIRLRAIRSPSHKTARVLMQGENGRRNYSKYNRYITLMNITEYNEDFKLKKCGEMTSKNENSKMTSNELNKLDLKRKALNDNETELIDQQKKINFKPEDFQTPTVLESRPEVVKNSNNSRTGSKECNPRTCVILENGDDQPVYKCSKCNFRHPNRDAVLVHVKIHHQDVLNNSMNLSKSPKTTNESNEDPKINLFDECKNSAETDQSSKNNTDIMLDDLKNENTQIDFSETQIKNSNMKKPSTTPHSSPVKDSTKPLTSPVKDSMENNDIGVDPMTNDKSSSSYNDNYAPFRCWHCHQVSNWKHVIQRHCRLKHSGSIRIEAIDRSTDANNPIYRMLNLSSNFEVLPEENHQLDLKPTKQSKNDKSITYQNCPTDSDTELSTKMQVITLIDPKKSQQNDKRSEQKKLKFECKNCPYISSNKKQLKNHTAQKHKPSSFVQKTAQKACEKEKVVIKTTAITATATKEKEICDEKNTKLDKCQYCSFASSCHSAMKCHEQSHHKVLNQQICESNIKEPAISSDLNIPFEKIEHPTATSNVKIKLAANVTDRIENILLKKDFKVNRQMDKIDKEIQLKIKNNKASSLNSSIYKKKVSILPVKSNRKTILVNPKTGQIVRRN